MVQMDFYIGVDQDLDLGVGVVAGDHQALAAVGLEVGRHLLDPGLGLGVRALGRRHPGDSEAGGERQGEEHDGLGALDETARQHGARRGAAVVRRHPALPFAAPHDFRCRLARWRGAPNPG